MTEAGYRALIVDDDKEMRTSLACLLDAAGWSTQELPRADAVAAALPRFTPDVVLADMQMPGMSGLDLVEAMTAEEPPVVLITAHGDIPTAVTAMQRGAYSFLEKPFDPRRLLSILEHAAQQHRLRASSARLKARLHELARLDRVLLGTSPQILALRDDVASLADVGAPVLLRGETGTGKELVARAMHDLSARAEAPFVALSGATLPSEGAADALAEALAKAGQGTLFLDEVGACPPAAQAQLLRLLETDDARESGAAAPRIVSATNEDLEAAVAEGRFRADLLYRLNTVTLTLPSLRERQDDIAPLFSVFLERAAQTYETAPPALTNDDLAALLTHDWPGNVRELRHVAERRVLSARRGRGSVQEALGVDEESDVSVTLPTTLREAVAVFERELIAKALIAHEGRMDAVAEALGIGRRTLNEKIVKLGLDKDAVLAEARRTA